MNNMYNFVLAPLSSALQHFPCLPPPPPFTSSAASAFTPTRPYLGLSASATKILHLERPRSLQSVFTVCAPVCRSDGLTFAHAYWWEWYGCEKSIVKRHYPCNSPLLLLLFLLKFPPFYIFTLAAVLNSTFAAFMSRSSGQGQGYVQKTERLYDA